jgi:hypothetical protein
LFAEIVLIGGRRNDASLARMRRFGHVEDLTLAEMPRRTLVSG